MFDTPGASAVDTFPPSHIGYHRISIYLGTRPRRSARTVASGKRQASVINKARDFLPCRIPDTSTRGNYLTDYGSYTGIEGIIGSKKK